MFCRVHQVVAQTTTLVLLIVCSVYPSAPAHAAYISEIDLGGQAGQGIELSNVDGATDYTLLIIDANPFSPAAFGMVLDVIELPGSIGQGGVAMVTDLPWPDNTATTTPLSSLTTASGDAAFPLNFARLLVVMQGQSTVQRFDQPLINSVAETRYNQNELTDWLVLGNGDFGSNYLSNGHDIADINATLGIDLITRLIDKDTGQIVARTNLPGEVIDMDQFFSGTPNVQRHFDLPGDYRYTYTPGSGNLQLTQLPEPSSFLLLVVPAGLLLRRRRPLASS